MQTKINFLRCIIIAFIITSCYPGETEYIDEADISISYYEPDYNWDSFAEKSFTLPENIRHIIDNEDVDDQESTYDEDILTQISEELQNKGLTLVNSSNMDDVDIIVAVTIIEQNNTSAFWYPGYWWDSWYPFWGGGWYWGYYPWYPAYYNFKTGSVLIHMGDFENRITDSNTDTIPPIYEGAVNGLLQGSTNNISTRIKNGIDELFNQAPF